MLLELAIKTNSTRQKIIVTNDQLKVYLTSLPIDNRANEELIEYLAEITELPKKMIRIKQGSKSRKKLVEITGMEKAEFQERLCHL